MMLIWLFVITNWAAPVEQLALVAENFASTVPKLKFYRELERGVFIGEIDDLEVKQIVVEMTERSEGFFQDETILIQKLERKEYLIAANYLARAESRLRGEDVVSLRDQILSGARHLFWRSWSLERKDPGESYRLQREAQQICQQFKLKPG